MAGYKDKPGKCVMCGRRTEYTIFHGETECYVCHPYNELGDAPGVIECKADLTELVCKHGNPGFMGHLPFANSALCATQPEQRKERTSA